MIERQEISIIDSNQEYCIFFPKVEARSRLDEINEKFSPVAAVVGAVLLYDGFATDNSKSMFIGGSLALLSAIGIKDRIDRAKSRRSEHRNFVSEASSEVDIFTLL